MLFSCGAIANEIDSSDDTECGALQKGFTQPLRVYAFFCAFAMMRFFSAFFSALFSGLQGILCFCRIFCAFVLEFCAFLKAQNRFSPFLTLIDLFITENSRGNLNVRKLNPNMLREHTRNIEVI